MQMLADATKQFAFTDLEESSQNNDTDLSLHTLVVLLSVCSGVRKLMLLLIHILLALKHFECTVI